MYRHSSYTGTLKERAKRSFLFAALALFLLSACPVRKTISLLFSADIENTGRGHGKAAGATQKILNADAETCDQALAFVRPGQGHTARPATFPAPFNPALPVSSDFNSRSHVRQGLAICATAEFSYRSAVPVYLQNRQLLI